MKSNVTPLGPKADKDTVRRSNLSLVLRAVRDEAEGGATRATVAARVGLTRAAVSSLVEQLLGTGLLTESGKTFSGQAGRPGTALKVARTGPAGLGVEINIDYVSVCVVDLAGTGRVRLTEHLDNRGAPPAEVLARAAGIAARTLESAREQELFPVGVALALPGLVSGGAVRQAPNLGWNRVPADELFAAALAAERPGGAALPVRAENEANLAALAELWFGGSTRSAASCTSRARSVSAGPWSSTVNCCAGRMASPARSGTWWWTPRGRSAGAARAVVWSGTRDRRRSCGPPGSRSRAAEPARPSWNGAPVRGTNGRWPPSRRRAGCWDGCSPER